MRKILLLPISAILFSAACLILSPQTESAPEAKPNDTATQSIPSTTKTPARVVPQPFASSTTAPTIEPIPSWTFSAPSPAERSTYTKDLAPEYQAILDALPYASLYSIDFVIAEDLVHIKGHETVTYFNAEDVNLKEIQLRLFPNILDSEMSVENITVDGKPVKVFYSLEDSLLGIQLTKKLEPKQSATININFNITIAQTIGSHYSVQTNFDNVLTLAHAYPMIAVYDDEGWNTEIPEAIGDMTYADMSFYVVTVEAPAHVTLVGSGREISREESGNWQRAVYAAGPARDFYLAASPDYSVVTSEVNGVTLRFYARESQQEGAIYALESAARAIKIFSTRYAPYPYRELDFVSTPTNAGGIEYPGMIAIAREYITPDNTFLESIVAHEVGHQWFYNLVGNDQLDEPWLDESLTQFVTLQYFTDTYGESGARGFRKSLQSRWDAINEEVIPIGMPVRAYTSAEYSAIIYGRGALFFEALRDEIGAETFDLFIKDYAQKNAWGISSAETLKTKAEENCACDLTPLFQNWIYP